MGRDGWYLYDQRVLSSLTLAKSKNIAWWWQKGSKKIAKREQGDSKKIAKREQKDSKPVVNDRCQLCGIMVFGYRFNRNGFGLSRCEIRSVFCCKLSGEKLIFLLIGCLKKRLIGVFTLYKGIFRKLTGLFNIRAVNRNHF